MQLANQQIIRGQRWIYPMADWTTLRARFPQDEYEEIERIKEQYDGPVEMII